MITINRKMILFELLVAIMFFCQFRLARRQGYILFPIEIGIICLFWMWNTRKSEIHSKIVLLYIFFIIYRIFFSFIMSGGNISNIKTILYKELGIVFICYLLVKECSKVSIITKIRNFGVVTALFGCYEFATHSSIFMRFITVESRRFMEANLGTSEARARSIFIHPTICGVFMTVSWLCVLFIPYKRKWLNILAETIIFLCLLGTQSRSTWISFGVVNLIYLWKRYKEKGIYLKLRNFMQGGSLILFVLGVIIIFNDYVIKIYQIIATRWISGMDSNNAGNYNRVTMIKIGLREWKNLGIVEKLLGSGSRFAYNVLLKNPIRGWNTAVDNQYLTVLLDFGLIGLVFMLYLAWYVFKRAIKDNNKINQLCCLSLLSMFISSFFYEMFSWMTVTIIFSLFLCMIENNNFEKVFRKINK